MTGNRRFYDEGHPLSSINHNNHTFLRFIVKYETNGGNAVFSLKKLIIYMEPPDNLTLNKRQTKIVHVYWKSVLLNKLQGSLSYKKRLYDCTVLIQWFIITNANNKGD